MADRVRDYLNMQTRGFKKSLAKNIVDRSSFISVALRSVLFYYLNREEYK